MTTAKTTEKKIENMTSETTKTTTKATTKRKKPTAMSVFNAVVDRAVKGQETTNADWKEATWRAVEFAASKDRNLEPVNILISKVHGCKSLRTMALVEYFKHLATVDGECLVEWSAKELKFTYASKSTIPTSAVAMAKKVAFWEFKKENIHSMVKFDLLIKTVKKLRSKSDDGKALITAGELKLLADIEKIMVKADPTIFEKKSAKK